MEKQATWTYIANNSNFVWFSNFKKKTTFNAIALEWKYKIGKWKYIFVREEIVYFLKFINTHPRYNSLLSKTLRAALQISFWHLLIHSIMTIM